MKYIRFSLLVFTVIFSSTVYSQRGKNGPIVVTSTIEVNEYTLLTVDAATGNASITVANSNLNSHLRFTRNLEQGDLVMIIQTQGTSIKSGVSDSTWGSITSYNNCGLYELREVLSVPNITTINLTCPLTNNYTASGNVQVVRIPRYNTLTVNAGGTINCDVWDGQTGGILAMEVMGVTTVNGSISADSAGFRGGQLVNMQCCVGITDWATTVNPESAEKGEGIAGYQLSYNVYGGMYSRGAAANAGGGGDGWNSSGGGGGNGGNISAYNGNGNPDISNPSWITAWNLEYNGFAHNVSSGGGRGGYSGSTTGPNPLTIGPGNVAWQADYRRNVGGKGGRPLDYSTGRLFMGGGGGAGHENNMSGSPGNSGGGLVYLVAFQMVTGTGNVTSNGARALTANPGYLGDYLDGQGGGGAGGTVIINSTETINGISVSANGGAGSNQNAGSNPTNDCEGGGGGGSGGYIGLSNSGVTESVIGGANGTTNSIGMAAFPADGGTMGGGGDTGRVTNFIIVARNDTVCNSSVTLHASLLGSIPPGTVVEWYDSITGGNLLSSGVTYTTPVLSATTIFYVTTCPGDYRLADTVFEKGSVTSSTNDSICMGDTALLIANAGGKYLWSTNQTTDTIKVAPGSNTIYTLTDSNNGCKSINTFSVKVIPLPQPLISGRAITCKGIADTLAVSGVTNYVWSNGLTIANYITGVIKSDSTIFLTAKNKLGCTVKDSFTISELPTPGLIISHANGCINTPVEILATATGSGLFTYLWLPGGQTSDSILVNNTIQTYTVLVSNGCKTEGTIKLTPYSPTIIACCNKIILKGNDTTIIVKGDSSIKSFTWLPSVICLNPPVCDSVKVNPTVTTTYTVTGKDYMGCEIDTMITIIVEDPPCINLEVPNVFTPTFAGNSGLNSVFFIKTENINTWSITIYDRWGKEIFKSNNQYQYWDGNTEGGERASDGVYYYIISATCQSATYRRNGFVQLIR